MYKSLALFTALVAVHHVQGQARLVAGWDFGQFVFPGMSSTDPVAYSDGTSIPANHSESAGISPVVTHEDGQPLSAGTGAIYWDGSFGSSAFNASFDGEVQAAPGTREISATVPGTTVVGAATFARTLSNIDSDPADQGLLIDGAAAKSLALRVDFTGFQDFAPAAQGNFANLAFAAASNSGATILWSLAGGATFATTTVPAGTLAGFAAFAVDLPAEAYGQESTLLATVSGGLLIVDNLQINGLPAAVVQPPAIVAPPTRQAAAPGGSATFTVETAGPAAVSYRWQRGDSDLEDGTGISGATTAVLTISDVTDDDLGLYRVVITFPDDVVLTSEPAALVFEFAPVFNVQPPAEVSVVAGGDVTISASVDGEPAPTLRWHKDGSPLEDGDGVAGAFTAELTLSNVAAAAAGEYTLVATSSFGSFESTPAVLSVDQPLAIVTPPAALVVAPGGEAIFNVTAQGEGELSYQWLKGGSEIEGATAATLALDDVDLLDAGLYSVRVTDDNGSLTSSGARLIVGHSISGSPKITQAFVPGLGLVLVANITLPEGGSYQWLRAGKPIDGATSATLVLDVARISDSGLYSVRIRNAAGRVVATRPVARLKVTPAATYDALVRDPESGEPVGRFQVGISDKGTFTGQLRFEDGKTYAFKGALNFSDNGYEASFGGLIKRKAPLAPFAYNLVLDAQSRALTFGLLAGDTELGATEGRLRQPTSALPAWSGVYSLTLAPLPTDLPDQPETDALLKAVVAKKGGAMKITGKLADNTKVTLSAPASVEGDYAHWLLLHRGKGRLVGDLRLEEQGPGVFGANLDSSGEWIWLRPANPKSKVFPGGVDLMLEPVLVKPVAP